MLSSNSSGFTNSDYPCYLQILITLCYLQTLLQTIYSWETKKFIQTTFYIWGKINCIQYIVRYYFLRVKYSNTVLTRRILSVLFLPTPRSSCLNASNETLLELRSSSLRDLFFNKAFPISWHPSIPKPFQATLIDSRVSLFYNKNQMLYWVSYSALFPYKRTPVNFIFSISPLNSRFNWTFIYA